MNLLVGEITGGGFETLRGDKTQSFITKNTSLQLINKSLTLHALSLSLSLSSVSLNSLNSE